MNIDDKLKNLKDITEKIEDETISLDESLKLFNEGVELVKDCSKERSRRIKRSSVWLKG